ncbi:uncharacterized protein LOC120014198 [Tripterygium wilfordii]|uniref:uncharacterized protein LOC120014198 n=1 Tax=Tripterygium wilfordii TaxID=458696 RepID=UPI0018F7F968|nr:uncharacterized protein LOC120014198 [Tripterygium wilfordii]
MLATGERQSGRGANQMSALHRAGATRWSSHYDSVRSLIEMYGASCKVLEHLSNDGAIGSIRGEASGVCAAIMTFEFIFLLHLIDKIMGITDLLCQALQRKSLDILNALRLVSTTKALLSRFRQDEWDTFFEKVKLFCTKHDIDIPDMGGRYRVRRSCQRQDPITIEHYYHFDVFNEVIDFQLMELNSRFNEKSVELLTLSSALDPSDSFKAFKIDDICNLASKFYTQDFSSQEIHALRCELEHYQYDVILDPEFQRVSTLSELCHNLVTSRKSHNYYLTERLIRLVLTLPVSTATTERAFSAMKHVKTALRNKMDDEFLADCMVLYIERELAEKVNLDSVIDDFYSLKSRRAQLQ